jgi:hypothetical protein
MWRSPRPEMVFAMLEDRGTVRSRRVRVDGFSQAHNTAPKYRYASSPRREQGASARREPERLDLWPITLHGD